MVSLIAAALAGALTAGDWRPLEDNEPQEISGLAQSRRATAVLWAHNDSGNAPLLYRLTASGAATGRFELPGLRLLDWEDIAAFRHKGQAALLLADTGDNFNARKHVSLYAVSDPGASDAPPQLLWRMDFRYEDGPRDCEAVAVDEAGQRVLLISKRDVPPVVYELPLPTATPEAVQIARRVAAAPEMGAGGGAPGLLTRLARRFSSLPTGMDIAANGRMAVVVTYGEALIYAREPQASWTEALLQVPLRRIALSGVAGVEAVALDADGGVVYLGHEGHPPGFARFDLHRP